jgi:hypothetical protein
MTARLVPLVLACSLLAGSASAQPPSGSITGSVTNADGTPAAGTPVAAMDLERSPQFRTGATETDARGSYTITGLLPGRYLVAAGPPEELTYAPGLTRPDGARVVIVAPGQPADPVVVTLPSVRRPRFTVRGRVRVVPDVRPLPTFTVNLSSVLPSSLVLRADTGADGTFTVSGVPAGAYVASIQPNPLAVQGPRVVVDDRDVNAVEVTLPATVQVSGRVSVEDDGLMPARSLSFEGPYGSRMIGIGSDGRFTATLPHGEHRMTLTGYSSAYLVKTAASGSTNLLTSTLRIDGVAVPEIQIVFGPAADRPWKKVEGRLVDRGSIQGGRQPTVLLTSPLLASAAVADVDANGRFEFPRVPPGSYRLQASPGEIYEPTPVTVEATDVTDAIVTRPRQVSVSGLIRVEPAAPLPRASIDFVRPSGTKRGSLIDKDGRFGASLAEGAHRVIVSNLPQGFTVRSIAAGGVDLMREPLVLGDAAPPDIVVELSFSGPKTVSAGGRVVGLDVSRGTKTIVWLDGSNLVEQRAAIAPDGTFRFENVLPGNYTLRLMSPELKAEPPVRPLTVQVGTTDVTGVELRVSTAMVTAVVEVAGDSPVPQVSLMFNGGAGSIWSASNLEGTGRELHVTLPAGDYRVSVIQLTTGYMVAAVMNGDLDVLTMPLHVVEGRPITLRVVARSTTAFVAVSGRLLLRDPAEALPETISLYRSYESSCRGSTCSVSMSPDRFDPGPRTQQAAVDPDGSFSFPRVSAGSYVALVWRPGQPERRTPVVVGDADRRDVEIVVPALVAVTGRFLIPGDTPPIHPAVVLSAPGAGPLPVGVRQTDGSFRMTVPEGTYKLEVDGLPSGYVVTGVAVGDTATPGSLRVVLGMPAVTITVQAPQVARWKRVTGRVINSLGAGSTSKESIVLSGQEEPLRLEAMIGPDGAFEFQKVLPGVYTVRLEGGDYPRLAGLEEIRDRGPIVRVGSGNVLDLRIERLVEGPTPVHVEYRVLAEDGGPLPSVSFLANGRSPSHSERTDGLLEVWLEPGDQQISLSPLPDGFIVRSLRYGDADLLRQPARIVEGRTERLEVVLATPAPRRLHAVRGQLVGQERLGEGLVLALSVEQQTLTTKWASDGSFEFARVAPGKYSLSARLAGGWWIGRYVGLGEIVVADGDVSGLTVVVPSVVSLVVVGAPGVDVTVLEPQVLATTSMSELETGMLFVRDGDRVKPGELPPGYRVEALTFGDIDLLREPIRIGAAPLFPIRATIGRTPPDPEVRTFSVSGRVTGAPTGTAGARRVRMNHPGGGLLSAPIAADGSFRFSGVPAGVYEMWLVNGVWFSRVIVNDSDVTGVALAAP